MTLVEFIHHNPISNMDLLNKRGRELEKILENEQDTFAYINDADLVRVKVSGNVCYNVPYGNVEKNHGVSFLEHTHGFTDTFLVPEEFAKSNYLTERYFEYEFMNHMSEFASVSNVVVSPEGGQN